MAEEKLSVRRACNLSGLSRSAWYSGPGDRLARDGEVIDALGDGEEAPSLGLLEVLPPPSSGWPTVEPQAGVPDLQGARVEPQASDEETAAAAHSSSASGACSPECCLVGGLRARHALLRSPVPDVQRDR